MFKGIGGLLSRQGAAEAIASRLGLSQENIHIVSLKGKFGTRSLDAHAYVFSDPKLAERQLPDYLFTRRLPKDERKKAREEKKKAKASATSPAGAATPAAKKAQ